MKRYITVLCLVICLLSMFSVCAIAEESVAVIYGADFNYTVNIPVSVASAQQDNQHYAEISLSEALLPSNTELTITVTSKNYDAGWTLSNTDTKLRYSIMAENDEGKFQEVKNNGVVLQCAAGEASINPITRALCFVLGNTATGTYNDILTFVIEYVTV